jgi:uncharacterized protein (DUF2062 family)
MLHKTNQWLKQFFTLNDTPHRIALGAALGIFLGLLPGTGPLAALVCASALRVNKAAACAFAIATNSWLSVILFIPAVTLGSVCFGIERAQVLASWKQLISVFSWSNALQFFSSKIILPIITGYFIISFVVAGLTYSIVYFLSAWKKRKRLQL